MVNRFAQATMYPFKVLLGEYEEQEKSCVSTKVDYARTAKDRCTVSEDPTLRIQFVCETVVRWAFVTSCGQFVGTLL